MKKILDYINKNMVGYRKMTMAAVFLFSSIALLVYGYVPGEHFIKDVGFVMIAFFGANLAEHHVKKGIELAKKIDSEKLKELAESFKDKF